MPTLWNDVDTTPGYSPEHPYVRRFWTAVVGPGAVADLLRLVTAARRQRSLRLPLHVSVLAREGLVRFEHDVLLVRAHVPLLSVKHLQLLPPALRAEHRKLLPLQER